jgi:hypothetical protein
MGDSKNYLTLNSTIEKSKAFFIKVFWFKKIIDLCGMRLMSFDTFFSKLLLLGQTLSNCENKSSEF